MSGLQSILSKPGKLLLIWILLPSALMGHPGEKETILAGAEIGYPPYSFLDEEDQIDGFSIELLELVLEAMDREPEFRVDTWAVVKNALAEGELEVLPVMGRTPEREELFDFTFPYLKMHGGLVTRKSDPEPSGFEEMEGKRIAVLSGDNAEEFLRSSPVQTRIIPTETFVEAMELLDRGEADGVVIQRFLALRLIDKMELDSLRLNPFIIEGLTQNFCIAVQEGNKALLGILNEGLALVMANGSFDRLQEKWFFSNGKSRLLQDVLVVGGAIEYPPYEFLDSRGMPTGFNVELTQAIAREMGLNVKIELAPWEETYDNLHSGDIDLIQGLFYSESRTDLFSFTAPHNIIQQSLFSRKGENLVTNENLQNKVLLVLKDDIMDQYLHEQELGREIRSYPLLEDALRALSAGEGDFLISAKIPTLYLIQELNIDNLQAQEYSIQNSEYCYGSLIEQEHLVQIFSEGLRLVKESGEYREIYNRWLGGYEPWYNRLENPVRVLILLFFSLMAAAGLVIFWIFSLRIQVKKQTAQLKESRDAIQDKEMILRFILEDVLDGFWDWELQTGKEYLSPKFKRHFGYSDDELPNVQESWQKLIDPRDLPLAMENLEKHIKSRGQVPFKCEVRYQHKQGHQLWVLCTGKVVQWDSEGKALRMIGCHIDISAQKQTQDQQMMLSQAVEQLMEEVIITEVDGSIKYVNPAFETLSGYNSGEVTGRNPQLLNSGKQDQSFYQNLWSHLLNGETWSSRICNRRKDGEFYFLEKRITPIRNSSNEITQFISIGRDITREKQMEERIMHTERMEAVGQLAGGIAHDFNNILTGILGYNELAMMELDPESIEAGYLRNIARASERAKRLVEQILTFSRQSHPNPVPLVIQPIIEEVTDLLRSTIPSTVRILSNLDRECFSILADPTKLHELILNIATNAVHAMEEKGVLTISTDSLELNEPSSGILGELAKGQYLRLSISDTGQGIPPELIRKIFEPFFTTKDVGEGTGMGLAVVAGILEEFGGNLRIQSELGRGTLFEIFFPRFEERVEESESNLMEITEGTQRLLFVDDEEMIRTVAEKQFRYLGYTIRTMGDSQEAWEEISRAPDQYDLIITDQTMPGISGLELSERIASLRPDLPIILCTGYSKQIQQDGLDLPFLKKILYKPVDIRTLSETIQEVLAETVHRS